MIESVRRVARRATRALALSMRSPPDGWLLVRMLAWRAILPVLKYLVPLPRLVRLMEAHAPRGPRRRERERRIATLAERVFDHRGTGDDCLELSLVTYRYLAAAGAHPSLVLAIRKDRQLPRGHAWVIVDGVPVHDSPSLLEDFTSLVTFRSGDRAQPLEMASDAEG